MPQLPRQPSPSVPSRPCNTVQRGATSCNTTQPIGAFDETNPIFEPNAFSEPRRRDALGLAASAAVARMAPALRAACDVVQHGATPRDAVQHNSPACKTNPIATVPLNARQLAAARSLAAGRSIAEAAREMNLNRSTVWRWQRDPAFAAELRRIHERMIAPAPRR